MHLFRGQAALHPHYRRDDLAAVLASLSAVCSEKIEALGLGILVCAFWGLVLYAAISYGLR